MRHFNPGWFQQQVRFLRRQFLQDGELPFTNVLSEEIVAQALTAIGVYLLARRYAERYSPRYGSGLIPKSAPMLEEIAEVWGRDYLGRG